MTSTGAEQQTRGWVTDASAFGARLAMLRQHKGWGNVTEAAQACGLPKESWRNWERDNREPRNYVQVCRLISQVTGVNLMWLMTGQADAPGLRSVAGTTPGPAVTSTYMLRGPRTRLCRSDRLRVAAR